MQTKAVVLIRVSDHRQEKEGLSLDNQEEVLRRYAEELDFEIVKEFRFQESADRKIRTRFMEMVNFVKRHKDVSAIISYRVDRLTRNYRDHVLMDELRLDYGKELHCVYDRLVINRRTVGRDIQDWDTKAYLAKQYLNRLKEDAFNSASYKLRHGEWPEKAPYGYRNQKRHDNRNWVYPEDFEANVVRHMYQWYATGSYSLRQIQKQLKEEFGVSMICSQVEHILKNPFYCGEMTYNSNAYPHVYECLLSRDLFEKVQAVMKSYNKQPYKYAGLPFLYRGILRCSTCGCSITPERKRKRALTYHYYHCTEYHGKHQAPWIKEETITRQCEELFSGLHVPEAEMQDLIKTLKQSHTSKTDFSDQLRKELQANLDRYEKRIQAMYEDKLDGNITENYFNERRKEYRAKQREIESQQRQVQVADDEYYLTAATILEIASQSGKLFAVSKVDEKRQLLKMLLQNCVIEDGNIVWELKKPYDTIFHYTKNQEWLPLLDAFRHRKVDIEPHLHEMRPMMQAFLASIVSSEQPM